MKFNYELSDKVKVFLENANMEEISIGCSDSQVIKIEKNLNYYFLKIAKQGLLTSEYQKLKWLDGKLPVPKIILYDIFNNTEFLITEAINGEMMCSPKYVSNPTRSLDVIALAFEKIFEVDIKDCPFDVSIDYKLSIVKNNVYNGLVKNSDLKEETLKKFGNVENVITYLINNKFICEPCFSHGDTSLPNIFSDDFHFTGFIDVGECGIADKWFDLAICEKSIIRNYGKEYVSSFYDKLKINPDREKIDYYLLMMELYL